MSTFLYSTSVVSAGGGRDGTVRSADGHLDAPVRQPRELGGNGEGTNPEQLFAAAYAACFHSALRAVARSAKQSLSDDVTVTAEIGIGKQDDGGFGIGATLRTHLPGLSQSDAEALVAQAHQTCPYSRATRGNVDVELVTTV